MTFLSSEWRVLNKDFSGLPRAAFLYDVKKPGTFLYAAYTQVVFTLYVHT